MSDWEVIAMGGAIILAVVAVAARLRANEAARTGELKYSIGGQWHVIRRADNPDRFEVELKILRAVPWFSAAALAFALVFLGLPV